MNLGCISFQLGFETHPESKAVSFCARRAKSRRGRRGYRPGCRKKPPMCSELEGSGAETRKLQRIPAQQELPRNWRTRAGSRRAPKLPKPPSASERPQPRSAPRSRRRARACRTGARKLTTIDNQIDQTTGTVRIRATFESKKLILFPNQFVNASPAGRGKARRRGFAHRRHPANVRLHLCFLVRPESTVTIRKIAVGASVALVQSLGGGWNATELPARRQVQSTH